MSIEQEVIKRLSAVIDAIAAGMDSMIGSTSIALDTAVGTVFVEQVKAHWGIKQASEDNVKTALIAENEKLKAVCQALSTEAYDWQQPAEVLVKKIHTLKQKQIESVSQ